MKLTNSYRSMFETNQKGSLGPPFFSHSGGLVAWWRPLSSMNSLSRGKVALSWILLATNINRCTWNRRLFLDSQRFRSSWVVEILTTTLETAESPQGPSRTWFLQHRHEICLELTPPWKAIIWQLHWPALLHLWPLRDPKLLAESNNYLIFFWFC